MSVVSRAVHFDSSGNFRCVAGESVRISFGMVDASGVAVDLSDRTLVLRLSDVDRVTLGSISPTSFDGPVATFDLTGTLTEGLRDKRGVRYEIAMLIEAGRVVLAEGVASVRTGPAYLAGAVGVPGSDSLTVQQGSSTLIVSTQGAPGAIDDAALALFYDRISSEADARGAATLEPVIASAGAAATSANTAATNANTKAAAAQAVVDQSAAITAFRYRDPALSLLTRIGSTRWPSSTSDAAMPGVASAFGRSDGFNLLPVTFAAQWDFTRASNATSHSAAGAVTTAASGVVRVGYRWSVTQAAYVLGGLMLEAQATNLFLQSNDLAQAAWTKVNATVPAAGALTENADTGQAHYAAQSPSFVAGTIYTFSAIASERAGSAKRYLMLYFSAASHGTTIVAFFDLATGAVSNVTSGVGASAGAIPLGGGKWLCWLTATATVSAASQAMIRLASTLGGFSYNGDGTSGLTIEHAQIETGDTPTSRIITTSAAGTRIADSMTKTLGAEWNPAAQTDLLRWRSPPIVTANVYLFIWRDAGGANRIECFIDGTKKLRFRVIVAGAETGGITGPTLAGDTDYRIAAGGDSAAGKLRLEINGAAYADVTPTAWPTGLSIRQLGPANGYFLPFLPHPTSPALDATEFARLLTTSEMQGYTA